MLLKNSFSRVSALALTAAVSSPAVAVETQFYGSFRLQAEQVSPDQESAALDDYFGFRDAYSRIGGVISGQPTEGLTASIKLEIPLDLANGDNSGPYNQDEDERIFKAQLDGNFGSLWIGKGWLPYYNAIAYPVDYFSSYYSGFATYTSFRKKDTLYYATPAMGDWSAAFAYSKENGNNDDDRYQAAVTYSKDGLTLSAAADHLGGNDDSTIAGLAAGYTTGPWYIGAKVEHFISDKDSGYGEDGSIAANILAQYTQGSNVYRAMLAQVDNYGETVFHLGWDHHYTDSLRIFTEYYYEQEQAAISPERDSTKINWIDSHGGSAFLIGARYDFSI
jgi:predicted porin